MKNVLVLGNAQVDSFAFHIAQNFEVMGYEVSKFGFEFNTYESRSYFGKRVNKYFRYAFNQSLNLNFPRKMILKPLYRMIKENKVELIVTTHDYLWPEEVAQIKQMGVKICLWFPDPIINFGKAYFLNANYDALFFKEPFIVNKINKFSNLPVFYLPECFNTYAYKLPDEELKPVNDLVAFGSSYSWRELQLSNFKDYNLKIFGSDPPSWLKTSYDSSVHAGYPIFLDEKSKTLLESKIVLNNINFGEIHSLSARIFETAGIGAFQIFDETESVSDIFTKDECATFKNIDEMIHLVDYYLENKEERQKISALGKKRVWSDHTYEKRIKVLLDCVYDSGIGFKSKLIVA